MGLRLGGHMGLGQVVLRQLVRRTTHPGVQFKVPLHVVITVIKYLILTNCGRASPQVRTDNVQTAESNL